MGFQIVVDERPAVGFAYVPGQRIAGRVIYDVEKDHEKITNIAMIFQGKIVTEVVTSHGSTNMRSTPTEKIYLFKLSSVLFSGHTDLMQGAHVEWPFDFTAPKDAKYIRGNERSVLFASSDICPLPPSHSFSTGSYSMDGSCYIKYKLRLLVNNNRMFHSKKQTLVLPFTIVSPEPLSPAQSMSVENSNTEWQSRSLRTESHTFKQKMQHVFSSNPELRTPSVAFETQLHLPRGLGPGQTAPLSISITRKITGPTDPEKVTLVLVELGLIFESETFLRVAKHTWKESYEDEGRSPNVLPPYRFEPPKPLPLDGTLVTLDQHWSLPLSRNGLQLLKPDFKTFTIGYFHSIKAEVLIRHEESGHEFRVKLKSSFDVYPPYIHPPNEASQELHTLQKPQGTQPVGTDQLHGIDQSYENHQATYNVHEENLPPYEDIHD